ncbi:protein kinase [Kitasatospora sp. NPDC049258]|uniref:protein kinase domain-containing protein n=1 Tax=Kitasatospora sp. NPDC049258 TaxID=3155394 RepID=UPI00341AAFA0
MDTDRTERLRAGSAPRTVGQGRYLLQDPLGSGGMASVHRAHDSVLGRTVAVKTLHPDLARDPAARERFRREARAVATLNHPNIVAVHDSGEDVVEGEVVQYIVMEYVDGRALPDLIRAGGGGAMDLHRALDLTARVLDALAYSHQQGLVHRDVKPANVMVAQDGTVKVMDFGIAQAVQSGLGSITRTGTVLGTPQYLSPEQAMGKPVDARSDLYSVGCMLFELVTGAPPFTGDTSMSVLYQHVQQAPPVPSALDPSLGPAVDTVVARALEKDPARRHPTAEAMADDIRRIAAGQEPTRHLAPQPAPADGWARATQLPDIDAITARWRRVRLAVFWGAAAPATVFAVVWALFIAPNELKALSPDVAAGPADPRATGALQGCRPAARGMSTVPSFTDKSPAEARSCAEIAGVKLEENSTPGRKSDKDTVVRQEPESYESVKAGSTVRIWISAGGDPRAVGDLAACEVEDVHGKVRPPSLVGMTAAKAQVCAEIAHLTLQQAGPVRDKHTAAGQVSKQQPSPMDEPTSDGTVKVWISSGGDPRAVGTVASCDDDTASDRPRVPSLLFMTAAEARTCADIAGLHLDERSAPDQLSSPGKVVKQEPGSLIASEPGSTVTIWISSGRP